MLRWDNPRDTRASEYMTAGVSEQRAERMNTFSKLTVLLLCLMSLRASGTFETLLLYLEVNLDPQGCHKHSSGARIFPPLPPLAVVTLTQQVAPYPHPHHQNEPNAWPEP